MRTFSKFNILYNKDGNNGSELARKFLTVFSPSFFFDFLDGICRESGIIISDIRGLSAE